MSNLEPWQSGPVDGVPALLQPVAHALLNSLDDIERALTGLTREQLASRPGGAASIDYHVRHAIGSLDRLFTYARGELLNEEQRNYLRAEQTVSEDDAARLLSQVRSAVENAIVQLRETKESSLTEARTIGRAKLPSTVAGLLFHGAEHTARHTGQIVATSKIVRSQVSESAP
jgi:uncharacterized damage-inducible protein DinB